MRRIALIAFGGLLSGCGAMLQIGPADPPPPVVVQAAPAPPAPPAPPGDATATADVSVEAAPEVTTADPEEVTATTEPPDPIYEEQAEGGGPGFVWVGGYWGWTGSDWGWYSGRWLTAPEGRMYVEPYYERVGPNVVYVRGYWGAPDAPRRAYGGERIRFAAAVRPADYRPGERPRFERRVGAPPGARPATFYEHASGQVRPVPRTTQPSYRTAAREPGREVAAGHVNTEHPAAVQARGGADVTDKAARPHEMGDGMARGPAMAQHGAAAAPAPRAAPPPRSAPAPKKKK